jgi:L-alanine-DL-glutamate epimerase-like enolase superfamily enzyme
VSVAPHFLMELHLGLVCAVPNSIWLEYIPQLDRIAASRVKIEDGMAKPSLGPGLGIDWDWAAIDGHTALGSLAVLA